METIVLEQNSSELPHHRTPLTITDDVRASWDRHGVSSEFMHESRAREQKALTPVVGAGPSLPVEVRNFALRSMMEIAFAKRISLRSWFQAVSLLDTYFLRTIGSIEMLPTTCVCLVRLLRKADCSETNDESSTWLPFTEQMAQRLAGGGFQVPETTENILRRHELEICQALGWQLNPTPVSQWISMFCTRFNSLSGCRYRTLLTQAENQALIFARLSVVREAPSLQSSPFELALGLFSLSLVSARLIPLDKLCDPLPPGVTLADMHAAYLQSQPCDAIPVCGLAAEQVFTVLEMVQVATCSKLHELQQTTHSVIESLAVASRDIQNMRRVRTAHQADIGV